MTYKPPALQAHISGSRLGPSDSSVNLGQEIIATKKPREMNSIAKSQALMHELALSIAQLKNGEIPNLIDMFRIYGELTENYYQLGIDLSEYFKDKEHSHIHRKIKQAKEYSKLRYKEQIRKAAKDAEMESLKLVETQLYAEVKAAKCYENLRMVRDAVGRASDYARSLISKLHDR